MYQEELILQNEELKLASEKAAFEADRYLKLFESAPSGYFILSKDGDIVNSNQSGRKIVATADTFSDVLEHKSSGGINDFLFKPYDRKFLNQLINKYFDMID